MTLCLTVHRWYCGIGGVKYRALEDFRCSTADWTLDPNINTNTNIIISERGELWKSCHFMCFHTWAVHLWC